MLNVVYLLLLSISLHGPLHTNGQVKDSLSQQQTNTGAEFDGGSKALGKYITEKFRFSKNTVKEFCYYSITISKTGSVTEVTKSEMCDGGPKDDSGANEKEIANILKFCPLWKPATKNGQPVEDTVSVYLKIYKNKVVVYF